MTDWFAVAIGATGIGIGTVAFIQARSARRSAEAALAESRAAADRAAESAAEADHSAQAATQAAAAAAQTENLARDRQHEQLSPQPTVDVEVTDAAGSAAGRAALVGSVSVARDYRVYGEAVHADGSRPLPIPALLRANQPYRFEIETWPADHAEPETRQLRLLFWPPEDADDEDVDRWACPCGRDAAYGDLDAPHWQSRVPIPRQPAGAPAVADPAGAARRRRHRRPGSTDGPH